MAVPTVASVGASNSGTTGSVTYTLPSHQTDDILLLFIETNVTTGVTVSTSGWAAVTNSPSAAGSNVTSLSVYWKRATSGAETNPVGAASTNHQVGFAMAVRGCVGSGNPWDFTPVASSNQATTSVSATGGTTTVADTLVVYGLANNQDTTTNQFSAYSNGSLTNLTEQRQVFVIDGNGGGVAAVTGTRAATGGTGSLSATQPSGSWAALAFALKPAVDVNTTAPAATGSGSMPAPIVSTVGPVLAPAAGATGAVTAPTVETFETGRIRRVGTGTIVSGTGTTASPVIPTVPGGVVADDTFVMWVFCASTGTPPTTPAGWIAAANSNTGGSSSPAMRIMTKRATDGESGTVNVTVPNGAYKAVIDVYRGAFGTTANQADDFGSVLYNDTTNSTMFAGGITTTRPGVVILTGVAVNSSGVSFGTPSTPAAFTELRDDSAAGPSFATYELRWSGTGATGAITPTQTGSGGYAGATIGLRPALWPVPGAGGTGAVTAPALSAGYIPLPTWQAPSATGSIAAPGVSGGFNVTAPAAGATGGITAPTVVTGVEALAPGASASGSIAAPSIEAGVNIVAPAGAALGAIVAPSTGSDATVSVPSGGATGSITVPDVGGAAGVTAVAAGATASAAVPAVDAGADVTAVASTATGDITEPVVSGAAVVTAPSAGATGSAGTPSDVNGGVSPNVEVQPPAATATGSAGTPAFSSTATVAAPSAGATGAAGTPQPEAAAVVSPPSSSAAAVLGTPTPVAGANVLVPDASANGSIEDPLVQVSVTVLAAAGIATAAMSTPVFGSVARIEAMAALATASMGHPRILWTIRDITATAVLEPREWSAETERAWEATL